MLCMCKQVGGFSRNTPPVLVKAQFIGAMWLAVRYNIDK